MEIGVTFGACRSLIGDERGGAGFYGFYGFYGVSEVNRGGARRWYVIHLATTQQSLVT